MKRRIAALLNQGENEMLDYKQAITSASKIAKTMSAFANGKGGTLLVGVKDNRKIAGIKSEDERYMLDLAAQFYCKPPIKLELFEHQIGDKTIIECVILPGEEKPYYAKGEDGKWWAHVRVKDQTLLASKIVLDVLKTEAADEPLVINYTNHEKALLEYLSENDRITLKTFKKLVNISHRRAGKIIVKLIRAGVIRSHTTEKEEYYTLV